MLFHFVPGSFTTLNALQIINEQIKYTIPLGQLVVQCGFDIQKLCAFRVASNKTFCQNGK